MPQLPQRQRSSAIGRPRHIPRDKSQPLLNDTKTSAPRNALNQNFVRIPSLEAKYTHFEEIGHGSQGRIYRAVQRSNDQMVVVKQLNVQSISTWKEYELFQREAKVLESMDIDGVAKFYEAIECLDDDPPCAYIVEEYIQGKSLKQMLDSGYRFSTHDVYQILIQTLQILDKLHHHDPPIIFRNLFQNGRKTIATIIDIQYLPAHYPYVAELNSKGLDLRTMDSQARLKLSPEPRVHSYFGSPDFIVTYAFNPPDDARTNDIIHRFITHAEPENHYQIGDSLPILYSIEKKHNGADTVTSMPFPFPLADCAPSELIDQSDSDTQVAP